MFKILIMQAQHNLSDARTEFMIRDRLSWMRFLGFALDDRTPEENTFRHFRNRMTETGTLSRVMKAFDWQLHKKAISPCPARSSMSAPKQRKRMLDARWTPKIGGTVRYREDGKPLTMIALPVFGYKSE